MGGDIARRLGVTEGRESQFRRGSALESSRGEVRIELD
jgi:hypothetical protein